MAWALSMEMIRSRESEFGRASSGPTSHRQRATGSKRTRRTRARPGRQTGCRTLPEFADRRDRQIGKMASWTEAKIKHYGSPTNSVLMLASADVKGFHWDANAFFTELEQGPVGCGQFGQSLTISLQLPRRFTLSGEIWHFARPFLKSNAVGNLWAASYAGRKTLLGISDRKFRAWVIL